MLLNYGVEEAIENHLDCKKIKPVSHKGNQSWIFLGGTDAEAEAPILWPPDTKSWLIGKKPWSGKDWRQKEKGIAERWDVGFHHQLSGGEFEQALCDGEGQGSLACYSLWGLKELDMSKLKSKSNWTITVLNIITTVKEGCLVFLQCFILGVL